VTEAEEAAVASEAVAVVSAIEVASEVVAVVSAIEVASEEVAVVIEVDSTQTEVSSSHHKIDHKNFEIFQSIINTLFIVITIFTITNLKDLFVILQFI
jgi:hypothetical protein